MKIKELVKEDTTSGCFASVVMPMGDTIKRSIYDQQEPEIIEYNKQLKKGNKNE